MQRRLVCALCWLSIWLSIVAIVTTASGSPSSPKKLSSSFRTRLGCVLPGGGDRDALTCCYGCLRSQ
uniref:Secreted protein n=1 Tax=Physcomitrium patens TaxID=3218 RepID=A0A2K1KBU1_PHYPA|nr:hypothetical protein PHYPA_010427 [Physcomitrium patens]